MVQRPWLIFSTAIRKLEKEILTWALLMAFHTSICYGQSAFNSQQIDGIQFTSMQGTSIQKVASEELITWPVVADWDGEGNLLVVESGGVSSPIAEHNKSTVHRIVRLRDTDLDGKFDVREVVVDKLPFTEGVLFHDTCIYACAPPNIWKFSDLNGDGLFEEREVWFDGQTITHCANDLHGPYLGRDGWIYWCKGAFADQTHKLLDGTTLKSSAAHIFRRHASGGAIEPVVTGGMDNPVEMAVLRNGERFFTSTFLHHPGNGNRDGIAHGIYGGVYGKPHEPIESHPRTGDLMPVMVELGPAAPSGLLALDQQSLLRDIHPESNLLVAALFNLQKVTLNQLTPDGATYRATSTNLLTADRIDFHPTDVLLDADGSLLVIDTGGWYDLCCPTSKIDQKTANGGIYRIVSENTKSIRSTLMNNQPKVPADWTDVDIRWLASLIHDRRPWVSRRAHIELAKLSEEDKSIAADFIAVQLSENSRPSAFRLDSLWALSYMGDPRSIKLCMDVLADEDPNLVHAACHILSLHRVSFAEAKLTELLKHPNMSVRRVAAEALGRIGSETSIPSIIDSLSEKNDRVLQHSLLYSMIEIEKRSSDLTLIHRLDDETLSKLQQHAILLVLQQTGRGHLINSSTLTRWLDDDYAPLADLATRLILDRGEKSDDLVAWLQRQIRDSQDDNLSSRTITILREWKDHTALREPIFATILTSLDEQESINKARQLISMYEHESLPTEWTAKLVKSFAHLSMQQKLMVAESLSRVKLDDAMDLLKWLNQAALASDADAQLMKFVSAMPEGTSVEPVVEARLIAAFISEDEDIAEPSYEALSRITLSEPAGLRLVDRLDKLSPRAITLAVDAITSSPSDSLQSRLIAKLSQTKAARTLNLDRLSAAYRDRSPELKAMVAQLVESLSAASEDVQRQVEKRLAKLPEGDAARGMQLFRSQKAACGSCHRVGYVGGNTGPELSRIGSTRTREALLEAIMFPSARLEQAYHSTKVLTKDGQVYIGLIVRRIGSREFEMQLNADKTVLVNMENVEVMEPSEISIMPTGLAELLSDQELADLLRFLESAK